MEQLEPKLFSAVGARVMLIRKLWTEEGLCNGSIGTISDTVDKQSGKPTALPIAVMIQSDNTFTGPSSEKSRCVAVISETSE